VTGVFDGIGLTRPLWPHQVRALAALDRDVARVLSLLHPNGRALIAWTTWPRLRPTHCTRPG
jgi:hypothetical protein